jgi:hypothetical protein
MQYALVGQGIHAAVIIESFLILLFVLPLEEDGG